jgi:hypothetical protein
VRTILLGKPERLDIHCAVKVFDHLGQISVHFVDLLQVDQPTDCSRWQGRSSALVKSKVTTYCA